MSNNYSCTQTAHNKKIAVSAPSKWLLALSSSSKVLGRFSHYNIPYSIDESIFKLIEKETVRKRLGISSAKFVIVFAAYSVSNHRKGFSYLVSALQLLSDKENVLLLSVGGNNESLANLGIESMHLGMIREEHLMSEVYNAADVFVIPSLEDNLPNTVIESLMCGTPVIGFPTGGIPDLVINGYNGLLTSGVNISSLAESITDIFKTGVKWSRQTIGEKAKEKYAENVQTTAYINLYQMLLSAV
jgi:glycosyltransferase involved in cell wall biosynthesis